MSIDREDLIETLADLDTELRDEDKFTEKKSKKSNYSLIILAIVIGILVCGCVYVILDTISIGTQAMTNAYDDARTSAASESYQFFYDKSYEDSEKAHHVKNVVNISVGNLREVQRLEVLKVYDVVYNSKEVENKKWLSADITAWLEVPGCGVFTVNLQASEFIIDDERQYVLVRIPAPELSSFGIDEEGVATLYYSEKDGFKEQPKAGADLAEEQFKESYLEMMERIRGEQEYANKAKKAAQKVLTTLVKQLNPQLPELVVEIEFME